MKILDWFKGKQSSSNAAETKSLDPSMLITLDTLAERFGVTGITESKAMKVEAYFSCIRDKTETVGQLPLKLYRKPINGRAREQITQGRAFNIFTQQPCDYLNMIGFVEMATATMERRGIFYAFIERNDRGSPMAIIPFYNQGSVDKQMDFNGNVYYTYVTNDGKSKVVVGDQDIFSVQMFTTNGVNPVSPIVQCATMLNIAASQDENYRELQEEGITAQMALKTEQTFNNPDAAQRLKDDWKRFRGRNGKREIPILEQGLTPVSLKLTPQESELLGNREFTINRICSMTRVPPHRIGSSVTTGTKSTIFELDEAYMMNAINPILVKLEHAFNKIVPDGYVLEFDRKAFYRGSPWRLVEAVEKEVKGGLANINEGRVDLGREPVEGGDVFAIDNNNVSYGIWTEVKELQSQLYGNRNNQGNNDGSQN